MRTDRIERGAAHIFNKRPYLAQVQAGRRLRVRCRLVRRSFERVDVSLSNAEPSTTSQANDRSIHTWPAGVGRGVIGGDVVVAVVATHDAAHARQHKKNQTTTRHRVRSDMYRDE